MLCHFHTEDARRARNGSDAAPAVASRPAATGSFEFRAHALLKFGHHVDEALAAYQPARARLEEAWRHWQEAIVQLPGAPAVNGELDTAAANGLLTGALTRADTGRHETRPETT